MADHGNSGTGGAWFDCPSCPTCGAEGTRWDAISPDYPGDWWECLTGGHRFILDHDGRAYVPKGY